MKFIQNIISVTLFSSVVGWGSYFYGVYSSEQKNSIAQFQNNALVAKINGDSLRAQNLPENLQKKMVDSTKKYQQEVFSAQYNFYRTAQSLLQAHLVSSWIKSEAHKKGISEEELSKQLLQVKNVTDEEVRQLFVASDPSAEEKDFAPVKASLRAYVEEVAKREAFDKVYQRLAAEGKIQIYLKKPENSSFQLSRTGFPSFGISGKPPVVTFVDYLCEECSEYNVALAELAQKYSSQAQFIFIPFPYTRPDRSLALARGALCAHEQGKYMDYHMSLVGLGHKALETGPLAIAQASQLNLLNFALCYGRGDGVAQLLQAAQEEANRAGVLSTPISFAHGKPFSGKDSLKNLEIALKDSSRN